MTNRPKPIKSPSRKLGSSDESANKFRNKIMGLSINGDPSSSTAHAGEREETSGESQEHKEYVAQLEQELSRRQESYVRRERQYKVRIQELEAQLNETRVKTAKEGSLDSTMDNLRQMHRSIMESVDHVQDRTSKILQEQEKDLLRAFRARLYSVQEELESEKNKTDDGASAWIQKSKQLETEVEWTKELADRLDRLNQSLTRENQRLKTQFTTQENDREFLVKQLVTVKKDNVRLRSEYESVKQQLEELKDERERQSTPPQYQLSSPVSSTLLSASTSALPKVSYRDGSSRVSTPNIRPNTAVGGASMVLPEADNRYKEIIKRLKRVLDVERRNLQQVRASYKQELQQRTELEMVLKECIQDVRGEIALASTPTTSMPSIHSSPSSRGHITGTLVEARLNAVERQRLIEKLLAKERLLTLLTTKAFPVRSSKGGNDPLLTGEAISPEEIARIYSEVASLTGTSTGEG
ncbi:hypothetical protein Poli38472_009538 [Pythium oligandrum]|uniref:Cilia- and flagella-associated protein 157 n=1 Tax=Pythium oligandrum TaxID=41045 RepID=A0A8K1CFY3_PYTOL|nr:hypothetical protein Poli38472_009538 [Pythium oligandrum]|eukprot:TMW62045.1 hypothetical protein Poli38472_009538 [Pythium oligandrum]